MELIGGVKAWDGQDKPHQFEVFRTERGYVIHLDGVKLCEADSLQGAIWAITEEAAKRAYHRRACA